MAKCPDCKKEVTYWILWDGENVAKFFMSIGDDQYLKCDKCRSEFKVTGKMQSQFALFMAGIVTFLMLIFMFIFRGTGESTWEFYHSIAVVMIFVGQYVFWRFFMVLEPGHKNKN